MIFHTVKEKMDSKQMRAIILYEFKKKRKVYSTKEPQTNIKLNIGFINLEVEMKVSEKVVDENQPLTTNN